MPLTYGLCKGVPSAADTSTGSKHNAVIAGFCQWQCLLQYMVQLYTAMMLFLAAVTGASCLLL